jgi:hypothetical protein
MSWTEDNENLLAQIGTECEILYLAYSEYYISYRKHSLMFIIPTVIISSVIGGLGFSDSFTSDSNNKYILGGFNIFLACLNSLYKILSIQDLETQAFYISKMWLLLYENIRIELAKAPQERRNYLEFVKEIEDSRMQLLEKNAILPKNIKQKYKKKYKDRVDLPIGLNHLASIKIFGRYNNEPITPLSNSIKEEMV